jgi:urate oxidase
MKLDYFYLFLEFLYGMKGNGKLIYEEIKETGMMKAVMDGFIKLIGREFATIPQMYTILLGEAINDSFELDF